MAPANLVADEPPEVNERPAAQTPPATAAPHAQLSQLPIGFGNPIALRIGFILAMTIMLVEMIPGLNMLFLLWWLGAGWLAVILYRRMTGAVLSVRSGARLGAMTGILTFIATTLISALTMAFAGKQVLDTMVKQNPDMQQIVNDPAMLGGVFFIVLVMFFCFIVGACAAGGALSARTMARRTGDQT
ncbi:MAG: hypothetical protein JWN34_2048 [Bryobacterales bacterium]|jgi:hypothetical protein|nr:hypothetical protein [Bryobacterales bacterium]